MFIKPLAKHGTVAYKRMGERNLVFWKGWRPLLVQLDKNQRVVVVRFIRGTFDVDKLIFDATLSYHAIEGKENQKSKYSRARVYRKSGTSGKQENRTRIRATSGSEALEVAPPCDEDEMTAPIGWTLDDLGPVVDEEGPLSHLALDQNVEDTLEEIRRWYKSKDWYLKRQIPWRRGLLLYGPPGTGKSALTKAIAQELNIPIFAIDISTTDNAEFYEAYQDALMSAPAMVLIEDIIDAVFHGRENVAAEKGKGLTFDCLLNTISGVEAVDGVLLVITTNNIKEIDSAMGSPENGAISSRPGRIDRAVEMAYLSYAGRKKIATRILAGCHYSWIDYLASQGTSDTGAQFQERCTAAALELFWSINPMSVAPLNGIKSTKVQELERVAV